MTHRITHTFTRLRSENRAALIPFIMGYDPDAITTAALLAALPAAGADLIEIGMPFSDPMADGPVIQAAGNRALAAGATVAGILALVREFRAGDDATPIILMGYYNPIYRYGGEKFCRDAAASGVDGIILVDLPPEEEDELRPYLDDAGLKLIRLVAPTSQHSRLLALCASASGFIYYISVAGITGAKAAENGAVAQQVARLRAHSTLPIAVGFGIKTPAQVKDVAAFADAVVVGSALVEVIARETDKVKAGVAFVRMLAAGLRR